uniref:NADH dehydrogenase subunit 6 n=1 Tax=Lambis lambis TaxID=387446 RepID=UPI00233E74CA|nr:NADH dehydrogenase subunit 6 [Lambis lambis]WBU92605.1 NADH dehydrogenase subunit 6 [Lambis lambis]WBU92618.1 NADH dehydrogenase subunit 6 [Lambis lambis]
MSAIMLFSITASILFLLPLMAQPLSLGLVIMLLTLMMCCLSALLISSWYGYILFLIYVGGLLVMFAYVAALSPNVLFSGGYPVVLFFLMIPLLCLIFYFYPFVDLNSLGYINSYTDYSNLKTYGIELVSPDMISVLIGLGLILLINLVVVVKICYYQHASLRPFKEIN